MAEPPVQVVGVRLIGGGRAYLVHSDGHLEETPPPPRADRRTGQQAGHNKAKETRP